MNPTNEGFGLRSCGWVASSCSIRGNRCATKRKEHVVLQTRCRIGNGRLTYMYLLNNEKQPESIPFHCNCFPVDILIHCVNAADICQTFYNINYSFETYFPHMSYL